MRRQKEHDFYKYWAKLEASDRAPPIEEEIKPESAFAFDAVYLAALTLDKIIKEKGTGFYHYWDFLQKDTTCIRGSLNFFKVDYPVFLIDFTMTLLEFPKGFMHGFTDLKFLTYPLLSEISYLISSRGDFFFSERLNELFRERLNLPIKGIGHMPKACGSQRILIYSFV